MKMRTRRIIFIGWLVAQIVSGEEMQSTVRYPFTKAFAWPSEPPSSCPFEQSKSFGGLCFTGNFANYTQADTWYPSWSSDGNLYSPYTDGWFGSKMIWSGGVTNTATGQAKVIGDDPLHLQVVDLGEHHVSAVPYGGRYPSACLMQAWLVGK
jgi:hypothetical protein